MLARMTEASWVGKKLPSSSACLSHDTSFCATIIVGVTVEAEVFNFLVFKAVPSVGTSTLFIFSERLS